MYKVVVKFADLMDRNHIYNLGDTYPREGYEPDDDRVEFLASGQNKLGIPVIEFIPEKRKSGRKSSK